MFLLTVVGAGCSHSTQYLCFHWWCHSTCLLWRLLCCENTQQTSPRWALWSLKDCRFSLYMQICVFAHTVLPARMVIKTEYRCKRSYSDTLHNPFCVFVVLLDIVLVSKIMIFFSNIFHGLTFLFGLLAGHLWQESVILQRPRTRSFSCVWSSPPLFSRSVEAGLQERTNSKQLLPLCLLKWNEGKETEQPEPEASVLNLLLQRLPPPLLFLSLY